MKKSNESGKPRMTLKEFWKFCYDKGFNSLCVRMMRMGNNGKRFLNPNYKYVFSALVKAKDNKGKFLLSIDEIATFLNQKETQEVIEKKPEIIIAILENTEEIDDICKYKTRSSGLWRAVVDPSNLVIKRAEAIKEKWELETELSAIEMFSDNLLEKKRKSINFKLGKKLEKTKKGGLKAGMIKVMMKLIPEKLGKRTAAVEQKIAKVICHKKQKD